jgi:hypothetical protein
MLEEDGGRGEGGHTTRDREALFKASALPSRTSRPLSLRPLTPSSSYTTSIVHTIMSGKGYSYKSSGTNSQVRQRILDRRRSPRPLMRLDTNLRVTTTAPATMARVRPTRTRTTTPTRASLDNLVITTSPLTRPPCAQGRLVLLQQLERLHVPQRRPGRLDLHVSVRAEHEEVRVIWQAKELRPHVWLEAVLVLYHS